MSSRVILDTGPLVAAIVVSDRYHRWSARAFESIDPPLITCEAVIIESCHLLRHADGGRNAVLSMVEEGHISIEFRLQDEVHRVHELMHRYESRPMSLADACLVRMAELSADSSLITLDGDFQIYRRNGRQALELIMPPSK